MSIVLFLIIAAFVCRATFRAIKRANNRVRDIMHLNSKPFGSRGEASNAIAGANSMPVSPVESPQPTIAKRAFSGILGKVIVSTLCSTMTFLVINALTGDQAIAAAAAAGGGTISVSVINFCSS